MGVRIGKQRLDGDKDGAHLSWRPLYVGLSRASTVVLFTGFGFQVGVFQCDFAFGPCF